MKRLATPLMALAIFLLNLWLCGPLFMQGELPFRGSIEGGYVSMARFVAGHPNPWGWNPFQYCGLPSQFMYVPVLPYLTALASWLMPHVPLAFLYRVIVSLAACLGPVTVFFFALYFTKSRGWAFAAALAYGFISLSYALFPAVEKDRGIVQLPWRIQVLAKYGEGPHNTGLTLLPLALLALWAAAKGRGYPRILLSAVLLAAIPLSNWVAAFALAIACAILLLAAWGEPGFRVWRALAAAGLAWLLACFWLTPGFIRTISFNWPVDSFGYQLRVKQILLLAGLVAGVALIRLAFRWWRGSFYFCLVTLGTFVFGWIATAFYVYGVDTIPESRRYAIEFELFAALAVVEGLRLTLRNPNQTVRMCAMGTAGVFLLVGSPQLWAYATEAWDRWRPAPREGTVEYRLAGWLAGHPSEGRVFASGGMRFRLNSWYDIQQVSGAFDTGLRNRMVYELGYRIRTGAGLRPGHESEDTLVGLKALGAAYVVVHGAKSREYYRDFVRPERVADALPVVFQEEDDRIYALPPPRLANLVKAEELPGEDVRTRLWTLAPYVAATEDASRPPLRARWVNLTTLVVDGRVPEGWLVAVRVNADPGWRAFEDGRAIGMTQDRLGFIVLHPAAVAEAHIELRYGGTAEQWVMAAVSGVAWAAALGSLVWRRGRGVAGFASEFAHYIWPRLLI